MATARSPRRQARTLRFLQISGFALCALALLILLGLDAIPELKPMEDSLDTAGWVVLAVGFVLLAASTLRSSTNADAQTPPDSVVSTPPLTDFGSLPGTLDDSGWQREPGFAKHVPPPAVSQWSADVFVAMTWHRFEAVCETLFAQGGFTTQLQSHGAEGGATIWLHSRNADGPVTVVHCKHLPGRAVGVTELREFMGVMVSHQIKRGTYATTATFTPGAQRFAKDNGINALDVSGLLALIGKRTPSQQQALLDVANAADY